MKLTSDDQGYQDSCLPGQVVRAERPAFQTAFKKAVAERAMIVIAYALASLAFPGASRAQGMVYPMSNHAQRQLVECLHGPDSLERLHCYDAAMTAWFKEAKAVDAAHQGSKK